MPEIRRAVIGGITVFVLLSIIGAILAFSVFDGGDANSQGVSQQPTATPPANGSKAATSPPSTPGGTTINITVGGANAEASIATTSCPTCPTGPVAAPPQVVERVVTIVKEVTAGSNTPDIDTSSSASASVVIVGGPPEPVVVVPAPAPQPAPVVAPPPPTAAPAPAPAVGCRVIHEYPLGGLPEVATSGSHIHVEFWFEGQPERETMLPARDAPGGRFILTRPLKGFVWEYAGCSDSEVIAQINAHIARRLAGKANNAGFIPWQQTGFFQPAQ